MGAVCCCGARQSGPSREFIRFLTFLSAGIMVLISFREDLSFISSERTTSKMNNAAMRWKSSVVLGGGNGNNNNENTNFGSNYNAANNQYLVSLISGLGSRKLIGDGMRAPVIPHLAYMAQNKEIKEQFCDRTQIEGESKDIQAKFPTEYQTGITELRWGGPDNFHYANKIAITEVKRYTHVREFILKNLLPALDVPNNEHLHVMSPALLWIGDRYISFNRISNYPDELYDNFLWMHELTAELEEIPNSGALVGIPTHSASLMAPGPEDPRAILIDGELIILFNLQFRNNDRRMVLFNYMTKKLSVMKAPGLVFTRAEKNWMPFVYKNKLHVIYLMDPLIILECKLDGECICLEGSGGCKQNTNRHILARGGSPLTPLGNSGLYIGLLHATFGNNRVGDHAIRGHFFILSTRPWGVVVMSSSLDIPFALKECYRQKTVPWDVQFPSSLVLLGNKNNHDTNENGSDTQSKDEGATYHQHMLIGVHIRDSMSSLLHADMQEPLNILLKSMDSLCEKRNPDNNDECLQWKVLRDGQVDPLLHTLLVE